MRVMTEEGSMELIVGSEVAVGVVSWVVVKRASTTVVVVVLVLVGAGGNAEIGSRG